MLRNSGCCPDITAISRDVPFLFRWFYGVYSLRGSTLEQVSENLCGSEAWPLHKDRHTHTMGTLTTGLISCSSLLRLCPRWAQNGLQWGQLWGEGWHAVLRSPLIVLDHPEGSAEETRFPGAPRKERLLANWGLLVPEFRKEKSGFRSRAPWPG